MKLIKQVQLYFREGNSDKVYEIDLCEVAVDQFVVSFRYGRRGSNLRDGTKTGVPVTQSEAVVIFDNLVESKTTKGYQRSSADLVAGAKSDAAETAPSPTPIATVSGFAADSIQQRILGRLAMGTAIDHKWKLSRAVWRCGELKLQQAEPYLLPMIGSGDSMLDYCIAWSLGQCGSSTSIDALTQLEAKHETETVRRISAFALLEILEGEARDKAIDQCLRQLPESLLQLGRSNTPSTDFTGGQFEAELQQLLSTGDRRHYELLDIVYLINNEHVRPALLNILATAPLIPNYFQRIRHIFKAAEMRRDAQVFGLLARRFDTTAAQFRMQSAWFYKRYKIAVPTLGPDAALAFSSQTRGYLQKRVWRTLKRLGELQQPDYVRLAAGVLKQFTDEDGGKVRVEQQYVWNPQTRRSSTVEIHHDRFSRLIAFNRILFGNSSRYETNGTGKSICRNGYIPGSSPIPAGREDLFPQLWNQQPEVVLDLLYDSRCEWVHQFGVKVLQNCINFCRQIPIDSLVNLLASKYDVTIRFAFERAVERFDPTNPNGRLVLALAGCTYQPAQQKAYQWINQHRTALCGDSDFVVQFINSPQHDTRVYAQEVLKQVTFSDEDSQIIIARSIAYFCTLSQDDGSIADDATRTLQIVFGNQTRQIGVDIIRDLLSHSLPELQRFAGELVLGHETLAQSPPDDIVKTLIESQHPDVRRVGVQIIGQLPDNILKDNVELLISLTRHAMPDVRETIRPTVLRLADADSAFAETIARRLIDAILIPGAPEGVPTHTAKILIEDLRSQLGFVTSETVWQLLQSRSAPAQEVGGALLATNVDATDLSVIEIVRLGNHEIYSVRQSACQMFSNDVSRMQAEAHEAVHLADSRWNDVRQFAFDYIRQHLVENDSQPLSPQALINVCDSARADVQQFGRELITKLF